MFFSIPGLGREVLLAVNRSDYPVIQAVTVYLAVLTMLINLLTDLLYKVGRPAGGAEMSAVLPTESPACRAVDRSEGVWRRRLAALQVRPGRPVLDGHRARLPAADPGRGARPGG